MTRRAAYGRNSFGQGCLLARRLIEKDVRFVEVSLGGWDTHLDNFEDVPQRATVLDQALSALMADLTSKGLLGRRGRMVRKGRMVCKGQWVRKGLPARMGWMVCKGLPGWMGWMVCRGRKGRKVLRDRPVPLRRSIPAWA